MYYNEEIEKIYDKLKTNQNGLTNNDANKRLKTNGKNILPKKKRPSIIELYLNLN